MGKYKFESYDYSKIEICKPKVCKVVWSTELANDITAFNNISVEGELTAILSEQIAVELDRSILTSLSTYTGPIYTPTYVSNREDFLNVYNNG